MASYKEVLKNIKLPKTKFELTYTLIAGIIALIIYGYIVINWGKVPDTIPTHYNALGQQDDEGSKWLVVIMPIIAFCITSITGLFEKHPEWGNYPARINEHNAKDFYLLNRQLVNMINNGSVILFAFISLEMILVGLGKIESIDLIYYGLAIVVLFIIPNIIVMLKTRKIK